LATLPRPYAAEALCFALLCLLTGPVPLPPRGGSGGTTVVLWSAVGGRPAGGISRLAVSEVGVVLGAVLGVAVIVGGLDLAKRIM